MISLFDSIADELAERGYAVADQFLSQEEVQAVLSLDDFTKGVDRFKKAGIGKQQDRMVNESIRGDYIQWLDKKTVLPPLALYLQRMDQLRQYLNFPYKNRFAFKQIFENFVFDFFVKKAIKSLTGEILSLIHSISIR